MDGRISSPFSSLYSDRRTDRERCCAGQRMTHRIPLFNMKDDGTALSGLFVACDLEFCVGEGASEESVREGRSEGGKASATDGKFQ